MSDFNRGYARTIAADRADMSVDAGLRSFMLGVYNKVALGLVLSAGLAYLTGAYPPVRDLMFRVTADGRLAGFTLIGMIVAFAPLVVLLMSGFALRNPSPRSASALYWTIVTLIGASLGVVVLVYTGASIGTTFLITATAFGALSLVGYTTKKDLTGFGSFLIMGVFGLIIASLVNLFLQSSMMQFIVSVVGVLIFAGLTAWDTQRLKNDYIYGGMDGEATERSAIMGALSLYLNFINLFTFLMQLLGQKNE